MVEEQQSLALAAALLAERNALDAKLAALIGRPALVGHIAEWIAAAVFDIELETSASHKAIDGVFRSGPLAGGTVNVKYYGKREGELDTNDDPVLDHYLVLTGPKTAAASSRGTTRPFVITNMYLFGARAIADDLVARGKRTGVASSVRSALWEAAEIYPAARNPALVVSPDQAAALALFGG